MRVTSMTIEEMCTTTEKHTESFMVYATIRNKNGIADIRTGEDLLISI